MMKNLFFLTGVIPFFLLAGCRNTHESSDKELIKSYCIDFNWGPGGAHGFAKPGLWADADPAEHVKWYKELGCNTIQTFAVSCNGYAWYRNGFVTEQPGLKFDFLPEMVKKGHEQGMKVIGYFCVGANNKWEEDHPDLCYQMDGQQIPFTSEYINYLCASIKDAVSRTGIDGIMLDWFYNPGGGRDPLPPLRWLECEKTMYRELMNQPFPGADSISPENELEFRRKAIDRTWKHIKSAISETGKSCIVWLTCYDLNSREIVGSDLLMEVDWLMNEAGDIKTTEAVRSKTGSHTRLITCLANWNMQDPGEVIPAAIKADVGLYGFTKPVNGSLLPPVDYFLSQRVDSLKGDEKNIALLARAFNGLPADYVKK